MRRCLVTGATGHVGSFLTRRLVREGWEVSILVRKDSDLWRISDILSAVTIIRGELGDLETSASAITDAASDIVFHLAWGGVTREFRNDPKQLTENVRGSLRLFELAHAGGCKRWIGLGSQAEYGRRDEILRETTPTEPSTSYGIAKLALFMLLTKLSETTGMSFAWIRLLATYGPMDDRRHLIPSIIDSLLDGDAPRTSRGEQRWDYLFIDDVVDAIFRIAVTPEADGVFNLGSGESCEVRKIVSMVRDLVDPSANIGFGDVEYGDDQIMLLQADITRISEATGWAPSVGLAEGLEKTIAWHRSQRPRLEQGVHHEGI